jgi:hypothetical protein
MTSNILQVNKKRLIFTEKSTISEAHINGEFICYFLEDKDRGLLQTMSLEEANKIKVKTQTCIPYGTFEVDITLSSRFKYWLPLLLNVLAFGGIREHIGNDDGDTEGCPLPGLTKGIDKVGNSTDAFYKLFFIYLNHLTLNTAITQQLIALHKKKAEGAEEFGKLFTKHRVKGQKILTTITK